MEVVLAFIFFVIALLYGAVGLGGGSGYLAAMSIAGLSPEVIRPTALTLNILVASIGTWKHVRAGQFSARIFWPIAAMSIPFAFLGGRLSLPGELYRPLVGLVLLYAAMRLVRRTNPSFAKGEHTQLPIWMAMIAGAIIGLVAGLVGIGGGIFLGPLLLLAGWADTKEAMGITAAFVVVNSAAGLVGRFSAVPQLPPALGVWIIVVAVGGWIGAEFGSNRLDPLILRRLLALVLVAGGLRIMFA
ncbi:MAG: sulfite exporter TauE/SafE family protein [Candidatus Promineifilaceae bacterium]|nr:sulfite exporter TauE/SafE family protein [Candidatus Promineifilaceae bacterium]